MRYRLAMLHESPDTTGTLETALGLHRRGLRLVPLVGKRAIVKDWPQLHLGESDIRHLSTRNLNWGIITGEPLIVLDTDTDEAESWVNAKGIDSPVMVRTGGGGFHRYFRTPDEREIRSRSAMHKIAGLDVKAWHSYVVAVGSVHPETGRRYEYLPGKEFRDLHALPPFDPNWTRETSTEFSTKPRIPRMDIVLHGHIRNVRAYIRGIQSIERQGGDRACFTVACLLAESGFSYDEALTELVDWNQTNAFPPWATKDLERKLRYAFDRVLKK